MRILHLSTRLILGGSQENTVLSCEGQARLGHEVHLAFGPIYGPEGSLLDRVKAGGAAIRTHVVPHLVREINPIADWRCHRELVALIRSVRPDIVHTHSSKAGILGRSAAWTAGGRGRAGAARGWEAPGIVHTIHGPPFMPLEGGAPRRLRIVAVNKLYEVAERFAARRCDLIVSVADAMTRQFLSRAIGSPGQYVTVLSGMETERFLEAAPGESREEMRTALGLSPADFVVGTVARLAEHKGHDDLLDALASDLRSQRGWKLLWVGDGWWRPRLLARARTLGLSVDERDRGGPSREGAQIVVTGLVPPESVAAHIRAMDVLVHPSMREGLPRTVPQALLCGVCPVAYDVDGTGEACRDGQTGVLVHPGDRAGLRAAIRRLCDHPGEREAMAARGREECRVRFSAGRMVEELEKVYARAVESARRRA